MIDRLRDYQNRILSVMGRAEALLGAAEPDAQALGQCRWELARILRAYQIHKHGRVFDPIIAAGVPADRVALARTLKADCVRMGDRFRDHLMGWSAVGVRDDWIAYRPAAREMIAALRVHLDRERAGIATLEGRDAATMPSFSHQPSRFLRTPLLRY
jgi:hypothetical protein